MRALCFLEIPMKKAIVIGSGFGGLAIACRLRKKNFDVTVLEKQSNFGGRARALEHNGFIYDAGPTVITAPYLIEELFTMHNKNWSDYYELLRVKPYYRFIFSDHTYFDYGDNLREMIKQIEEKYSKIDARGYIKLLKLSKRIFKTAYEELSDKPFKTLQSMIPYLPELLRIKFYQSVHTSVEAHINNENLVKALSMHPLLIGGNPYTTTSIYLLIQYLEWKWGVYYAKGGTRSIVAGLERLLNEIGVNCIKNVEVESISSSKNSLTHVHTNEGSYDADLVVSNADPTTFYKNVVKRKPKKLSNKPLLLKHSMSLFVLYFSTKKIYDNVQHHTIIFNKRHKELLKDIFDKKNPINDPSLYLHRPLKSDPSGQQQDADSFYVLAPVANNQSKIDWNKSGQKFSDIVFDILDEYVLPGVKENLVDHFFVTPDYFENELNTYAGSGFGIQPIFRQSAYFRYSNKSKEYDNLYFVGASTHPGAGVPGVISTAKATEKLILEDYDIN